MKLDVFQFGKVKFLNKLEFAQAYWECFVLGKENKIVADEPKIHAFCKELGVTPAVLEQAVNIIQQKDREFHKAMRFAERKRFELSHEAKPNVVPFPKKPLNPRKLKAVRRISPR